MAEVGHTLVINPGSSTIKYVLFSEHGEQILSVTYDKRDDLCERHKDGATTVLALEAFQQTPQDLTQLLEEYYPTIDITRLAFRVVHGGFTLTKPCLVTPDVLHEIEMASSLAPLHNPVCLRLMNAWRQQWPSIDHYAVFDTAFHAQIPEHVSTYALPQDLREKTHIRRYGFHGISYASLCRQLKSKTVEMPKRIIACHLGSGASICAIKDGKSIDTSMGTTPLEGLIMSSRVGDIDPGSVLLLEDYLARTHADKGEDAQEFAHAELQEMLYKQSGLKGIAGTHDMRRILALQEEGDNNADLAIQMFCYHIQKYIGSYVAILGGCDALIFGGGIGVGSALIREKILTPLHHLGFALDATKNREAIAGQSVHSSLGIPTWVLDPKEAQEIFLEVQEL